MKNNKGITLVALVITIIILLILAGIAIVQLTDSGLFGKAKTAKQKQENSEAIEEDRLKQYENAINNGEIISDRETVTIPKAEYDILKNANSYSTTEKVIGTWIDGKPIYQKVFTDITLPRTINADTATTILTGDDVNTMESLINIVFMINGKHIYYPSRCFLGEATNSKMINISILGSNSGFSGKHIIVVQYTKTTDTVPAN